MSIAAIPGKAGRALLASPREVLGTVVVAATLLWVFWPTLAEMADRWARDPQYSHGWLVPLFSLYLLWARRRLAPDRFRPAWWGLALLVAGLGLHAAGTALFIHWMEAGALLVCVAGLFALVGGRQALRWAWPAILFLVFMMSLPFALEVALAQPLRRIATVCSTYNLQVLGYAASSEANVIHMPGIPPLGVVEACSGLAMLVTFFALATAVALIVNRPLLDRLVIFFSAVPIALAANIVRITATGVLYNVAGERLAHLVFHDLAGWLMMPVALGLLWLELRLLGVILIDRPVRTAPAAAPALRPGGVPGLKPAKQTGRPARRRPAKGRSR